MVSSRGEQDAVRAAGAAGATRSLVLYFTMAMAGAIAAAGWRSPPPLAGSYGVDVDSTRLARVHGVSPFTSLAVFSRAREAAARQALRSATCGRPELEKAVLNQ